jgi:hypothetical protein
LNIGNLPAPAPTGSPAGQFNPGRVNRITIEDRLTGEVGCIVLLARPRKWGGVSFEFDNTLPEEVEKF